MRRYILLGYTLLVSASCTSLLGIEDTSSAEDCTRAFMAVTLGDGNFDAADTWTSEPPGNSAICRTMDVGGFAADSGENAACFGVTNSANQTLFQSITLPQGTTEVRVKGRRCFITTDPMTTNNDTFVMALRNPSTRQAVARLAELSNRDADTVCVWADVEFAAVVDDPITTVDFHMEGKLDDLEITTFFLDTLSIEAFACVPEQ